MSIKYKNYNIHNLVIQNHLVFFIVINFCLCLTYCEINNNITKPSILINKEIAISRLQSAAHRFSIVSQDYNFQLNGQVYQSQEISNEKNIYNLSEYRKSTSCTYFKSILQIQSLIGQNLDYISLNSHYSHFFNELYIVGVSERDQTKKFLKIYSYNNTKIHFLKQLSFENTKLSQNIDFDISITEFTTNTTTYLLVSDGNSLYILQKREAVVTDGMMYTWLKIQGFNTGLRDWKAEQFFSITSTLYQNKQLLMFLYSQKVVFYQLQPQSNQVKLFLQIVNQSQKPFQDIQIGRNSLIFALKGNQLYTYQPTNITNPIKYQLPGQLCSRIYVFQTTLHIICQYEKRNFIAQYYFDYESNENKLVLNRFYNELENYRIIKYVNNYLFMIGENDIIITSQGVNRRVLIDMPKSPYSEVFVSFGLENLVIVENQEENTFLHIFLAVGDDFIIPFKLKFTPAEVWCYIEQPSPRLQTNILIVRNTSTCQLNAELPTLHSVCMNLKPIQVFFQHYEMEARVTSIFVVIIMLLIFVIAFLCLGCVFKQNSDYNEILGKIKNKIKTFKSKTEQLKQI